MCGIIAFKSSNAVNNVYNGLKKLEYRGYDSCGIACRKKDYIAIYKNVGYISSLDATEVHKETESTLAIGHTRWATHGGVSVENTHPHTDENKSFAVVHNGIIENYLDIKNNELKGCKFVSETDTEVIPHLVNYYYNGDVFNAFKKAIARLTGSYAIVMINKFDNNIYFARKSSPMIISNSSGVIGVSSDIIGFNDKSSICYVPDNTIGFIDNNINIYDINKNKIELVWDDCSNIGRGMDKGEYSHYMIKEIMEIPNSLKQTYLEFKRNSFKLPKIVDNVLFVACGTSYHSSLMGKSYIEGIAHIPTECMIASEFIYNNYLVKKNTLAIFISQSGETADTLSALKKAKELGLYTLAITNVKGSSITNLSDATIYINVGAEICVASTKAYTSQVLSTLLLSNILLNNSEGKFDSENDLSIVEWNKAQNYLNIEDKDFYKLFSIDVGKISSSVDCVVSKLSNIRELHLIGKDFDYITSMEGSLKIKEVTYIFTDSYPCGELKHGTLSLIDDNSFVIVIATEKGIILDKTKNAMHEISARGGKCIVISQYEDKFHDIENLILLPETNRLLMPILSIIPIDLIAFKLSILRGINPDKPRNLAKSVTVE